MNQPLVSVLMTAFNAGDYIGDAIQSLLRQTYTNFELLVLDDGSIDNSREIVDSFHDERINKVYNEKNEGLVAARNRLVRLSRGKYIAFLDADDRAFPQRLQKQVEFLESSNISICGTGHFTLEELTGHIKTSKQLNNDPDIRALITVCSPLCNPSIMILAEVLKKFPYKPGNDGAEDYALWQELALAGYKFANLSDILITYRLHELQITKRQSGRIKAIFFKCQENYLEGLGIPLENRPRSLYFLERVLIAPRFLFLLNRSIKNISYIANCQIYSRFQFRGNGLLTPFTRLERYLVSFWVIIFSRLSKSNS